eukprot:2660196-Prymnesium_polylepis.1
MMADMANQDEQTRRQAAEAQEQGWQALEHEYLERPQSTFQAGCPFKLKELVTARRPLNLRPCPQPPGVC